MWVPAFERFYCTKGHITGIGRKTQSAAGCLTGSDLYHAVDPCRSLLRDPAKNRKYIREPIKIHSTITHIPEKQIWFMDGCLYFQPFIMDSNLLFFCHCDPYPLSFSHIEWSANLFTLCRWEVYFVGTRETFCYSACMASGSLSNEKCRLVKHTSIQGGIYEVSL